MFPPGKESEMQGRVEGFYLNRETVTLVSSELLISTLFKKGKKRSRGVAEFLVSTTTSEINYESDMRDMFPI